jgi:hypothetical protein
MMPDEPEDIDELLARLAAMRQTLEEAILRVEADHAAGRTGHTAYSRAAMIEASYRDLHAVVQARISDALAALEKS